jgi:hypothetical protein
MKLNIRRSKSISNIIFSIAIILSSCRQSNSLVSKLFIKNKEYTFFDFNLVEDSSFLLGSYKLYKNGDCKYYIFTKSKKKRTIFGDYFDTKGNYSWSLKGADTIMIMTEEYKYTIHDDTIKLVSTLSSAKKLDLWISKYQDEE